MSPIGPRGFRRYPEHVQRQVDVTAAAGWEALVEAHTSHALRFVALMAPYQEFDQAVSRYLDELDVRDPMAAAVRSRVLIALEHAFDDTPDRPSLHGYADSDAGESVEEGDGSRGLRRFRPDVLVKDIARKVRESEAVDEWVRLAVARAEEGLIRAHVDNAVAFTAVLRGHLALNDAVDDYLELMRVSGGRAQSVHQRAMARLADLHLPPDGAAEGAATEGGQDTG